MTADCTSLRELRIDFDLGRDGANHFFGTAENVQAIAVKAGNITGIEPAFAVDHFACQVRSTAIAAHHVAPAHVEFSDLSFDSGMPSSVLRRPSTPGSNVPTTWSERSTSKRTPDIPGEHSVMP